MKQALLLIMGSLLIMLSIAGCRAGNPEITSTAAAPEPASTDISWQKRTIERYGITLEIPEDWRVDESNVRLPPAGTHSPAGFKCADYTVANPAGTVQLSLLPQCGPASWAIGPVPDAAVVVKEKSNNDFIIRYFETGRSLYCYTNAQMPTTTGEEDGSLESFCAIPPVVTLGEGETPLLLTIELETNSLTKDLEAELAIADRIVGSLEVGE